MQYLRLDNKSDEALDSAQNKLNKPNKQKVAPSSTARRTGAHH